MTVQYTRTIIVCFIFFGILMFLENIWMTNAANIQYNNTCMFQGSRVTARSKRYRRGATTKELFRENLKLRLIFWRG